jgi:hypothetical protein
MSPVADAPGGSLLLQRIFLVVSIDAFRVAHKSLVRIPKNNEETGQPPGAVICRPGGGPQRGFPDGQSRP